MAVTTAGSSVPSEPSASETAAPEVRSSQSSWVVQVTTLSLILGCFLGLALQAQRSIREARLPATRFEPLARHYETLKQSNENLQQEMKELRHQILNYERRMADGKDVTATLRKQYERMQIMAGVTPVEGPGLVLTLKDAPPHIREKAQQQDVDAIRQLVIHDADLLIVLNELKAAGAEAIAISGADKTRPQRIVASSAPRCAGPSVRVNDALITGPFTIWAIGNPVELENALRMPGGLVENLALEPLEMMKIETRQDIAIPAYSGSPKYEYAISVPAAPVLDTP